MDVNKIPAELRSRPQWVLWRTVNRGGQPTKVPLQVTGSPASSTDPRTWGTFEKVHGYYEAGGYDGIGYVFSEDDGYVGIDLDGCRPPGKKAEPWAREIVERMGSYAEISPSETGVKIWVKGTLEAGRKKDLDFPQVTDKKPGIEIYTSGRYFTVTGQQVWGNGSVKEAQAALDELIATHWPPPPVAAAASVDERASAYVAKMPPAISGSSGHNATFAVACALVLGFGLNTEAAMAIMHEYNARCEPPWSERELRHKVESAAQQPGPRNYLRDARPEHWDRVAIPKYTHPAPRVEVRETTLESAAKKYLAARREGGELLYELGLPEVDSAIGGGVAPGEMVVIGARPSHGKSAVALQCLHTATANDLPCLMVSEEMSAIALGKRAAQYASEVPSEHWDSSKEVDNDIEAHFEKRAACYIVEGCGTVERVCEEVRHHVENNGVKVVAVDYAQLLAGKGNTRYEQVTAVSTALRHLASETGVVLIVLCQLSRDCEKRDKVFAPRMSDLKESGQIEQDADVILFLFWPHRVDSRQDPHEYFVYAAKNRNRPIHRPVVKCRFDPSRQKLGHDVAPIAEFEDFNNRRWEP